MPIYAVRNLIGEIDVLRSDEYAKLPGCLDGPRDQLNTVVHEVMHLVLTIPVIEEAKVVASTGIIQPRTRKRACQFPQDCGKTCGKERGLLLVTPMQ